MPDGFDDYAWQVEFKGWLAGVIVISEDLEYSLTFYDPVRLAQDIAEDLKSCDSFRVSNLIVLEKVTKENILKVIQKIADEEGFKTFSSGRDL